MSSFVNRRLQGRYLLSRDYMTLKLWDVAMERAPVAVLAVHEPLRGKLCDLYESDCIFDKFDCCMNRNCSMIATGTYNNSFKVVGHPGGSELSLEASRDPLRKRAPTPPKVRAARRYPGVSSAGRRRFEMLASHPARVAWQPLRLQPNPSTATACASLGSAFRNTFRYPRFHAASHSDAMRVPVARSRKRAALACGRRRWRASVWATVSTAWTSP